MARHSSPGVFIEEISTSSRPIKGVSSSIVAFIGATDKGAIDEPILIRNFKDYTDKFGNVHSEADSMGLAVQAYYLNGGGTAYICSLASELISVSVYTHYYANTLHKYRDISIIILPNEQMAADGSGNAAITTTLAYCEKMENCTLFIDPPRGYELDDESAVTALSLPVSSHAVLYYPWINMPNLINQPNTLLRSAQNILQPSSAAAAAVWKKMEDGRGLWKSPAGVDAQLADVVSTEYPVNNVTQEQLNPLGINCIRNLSNRGFILWGARTLEENRNSGMHYIAVHRLAIYIKESISSSTQWVAFETNEERLWDTLRANINTFMDDLFRQGALQGTRENDAYFVRCGLGDTMTQADIDHGRVIMQVGFAPLRPAEFIILRIQQKIGVST